jgi:hypothetical protein
MKYEVQKSEDTRGAFTVTSVQTKWRDLYCFIFGTKSQGTCRRICGVEKQRIKYAESSASKSMRNAGFPAEVFSKIRSVCDLCRIGWRSCTSERGSGMNLKMTRASLSKSFPQLRPDIARGQAGFTPVKLRKKCYSRPETKLSKRLRE